MKTAHSGETRGFKRAFVGRSSTALPLTSSPVVDLTFFLSILPLILDPARITEGKIEVSVLAFFTATSLCLCVCGSCGASIPVWTVDLGQGWALFQA